MNDSNEDQTTSWTNLYFQYPSRSGAPLCRPEIVHIVLDARFSTLHRLRFVAVLGTCALLHPPPLELGSDHCDDVILLFNQLSQGSSVANSFGNVNVHCRNHTNICTKLRELLVPGCSSRTEDAQPWQPRQPTGPSQRLDRWQMIWLFCFYPSAHNT